MTTRTTIPANIKRALSPAGRKLWMKFVDVAVDVNPKLQIHFAAYCNSRAEYEEAIKRIEDMENNGQDSFVAFHQNGTMGLHPIRAIADKARRAMADELKRCGLTYDRLEDGTAPADDDPFGEDDNE